MTRPSSGRPLAALRGRDVARVWAVVALFVVVLVAAAWSQLHRGERAALAAAEDLVAQQVAGAEANLNRLLLGVDLALVGLGTPLAAAQRADRSLDLAAAGRVLDNVNDMRLEIADLALVDRSGRTLAAALSATERGGVVAPAGFIDAAFSQPVPQLVVSAPVASAHSAEPSIFLARVVALAGGERLLAVAEVPVGVLSNVAGPAAGPAPLTVTIERDDGQLLATVPPNDPRVGSRLLPPLDRGAAIGKAVPAPARLGGAPALVASRPAIYPGLLLSVSHDRDAALATWRADRDVITAMTVVMLLLALAGGAMAQWSLGRLAGARAALAGSAATLDQALGAMDDGFLLCDADDCVVRWNDRYLALFPWLAGVLAPGVPYRRLAEVAARQMLPDGDPAERAAWVERRMALHLGGAQPWEADLGNGRAVHAVERRTPFGGVVAVYHDVTAAERRLAGAKAAAEAANLAKSQFLANISHEIRTPLNAVLGLNTLLLETPLTDAQRRHVELIRSSGKLLLTLINDLLDVSKIEAGRLELEAAPFDPARAAAEVVALLRERADAKGLRFTLESARELPPLVEGDPARVRQVMFNLIGNALKFTDRGEVRVRLGVRRLAEQRVELVLEVADTGIGIAADMLPTLFERFTQADAGTARRYGGSGLGLAITRDIVALMGGRIDVDTAPGRGSTFTAALPCRVLTEAAPVGEPATDEVATLPPALHLLVAEDNEVNQFVIQALLDSLGHTAEIVGDGAAAVERARQGGHDLVLLDVQMPVMDGAEAARAIRSLPGAPARLPIVAMTANARAEDRTACLGAGMDDYVSKPIDRDALVAAMARAWALRRPVRALP